ncbi:hypothetical protein LINPERPRIM_LOCUS34186, partial [Linum perenne]
MFTIKDSKEGNRINEQRSNLGLHKVGVRIPIAILVNHIDGACEIENTIHESHWHWSWFM